MEQFQFLKQMTDFNRSIFDNTFDIMAMLQDQTEGVANSFLDQASWVPEEGKKLISEWVKAYKSGCSGYKDMVDQCFNTMEGGFGASKKTKS